MQLSSDRFPMMMSSNGSLFHITDLLCGEFTGHQWIPHTKAIDTELWYFLWSAPEQQLNKQSKNAVDLRHHHGHYDVTVMQWQTLKPTHVTPLGPWFNIKSSSYQYRQSQCGDKMVIRSSYLPIGISYSGKMASLYWISHWVSIVVFSCDQAALWMVFSVRLSVCPSVRLSVCPSVRLSVCPSVCPSVTPFWLCSHHRIIMKFSGVITLGQGKVHAKCQGQRSKVKVTEVTTQIFVSGL